MKEERVYIVTKLDRNNEQVLRREVKSGEVVKVVKEIMKSPDYRLIRVQIKSKWHKITNLDKDWRVC